MIRKYFEEYPTQDDSEQLYQLSENSPQWLRAALADAFVYEERTPWAMKVAWDMAGVLDDGKVFGDGDIFTISRRYFKEYPRMKDFFYDLVDGSDEERHLYKVALESAVEHGGSSDPAIHAPMEAVYIILYSLWDRKASKSSE